MSFDVFISYSSDNKLIGDKLAKDLRTHGLTVWINTENLKYRSPLREALEEALKDSKAIVFIVDEKRKKTSYEQDEWSMALEAAWADPNKRLIPLLLGNAITPSFLLDYQAIRIGDEKEEWDNVISEIINVLKLDLGIDEEVRKGQEIASLIHYDHVLAVNFSPDGQFLVTVSEDGTAKVWDVNSGIEIKHFIQEGKINAVAFGPDEQFLVTASEDGTAKVWDVNSGIEIKRFYSRR